MVCCFCLFGLIYFLLIESEFMAKVHVNTNQGTHVQGAPCDFPFVGNIGAPLMATLNLPRFTLGLLIWFFSTLNVLNA